MRSDARKKLTEAAERGGAGMSGDNRCPTWLPQDPNVPHAKRVRCAVVGPHAPWEHRLPDEQRGLYPKYAVERLADPAGKHDDCWYFVLDPQHDPIARVALAAYAAEAERQGFSALANGLRRKIEEQAR